MQAGSFQGTTAAYVTTFAGAAAGPSTGATHSHICSSDDTFAQETWQCLEQGISATPVVGKLSEPYQCEQGR